MAAAAPAKQVVRLSGPAPPIKPMAQTVRLSSSASAVSKAGVDTSAEALQDRTERFVSTGTVSLKNTGGPPRPGPKTQLGLGGAKAGGIKGYSTELERPYLRLHFAPDPATIRPADVLARALALVKQKWVEKADFRHATEQLMAIQQDCKLQGIENELTCDAYETHLRIALEKADVAECTRCITSLNELYHKAHLVCQSWSAHENEMVGYRMLFMMRTQQDMLEKTSCLLARLTAAQRRHPDIAFATNVCTALMGKDYCTFFRLYDSAPKMAGYVMDFFVDRIRVEAFEAYIKAFQPEIAVDDLKSLLSFQKRKECFRWLREQGCVVSEDKRMVDTKESSKARMQLLPSGGGAMPAAASWQAAAPPVKKTPLSIDELLAAGKRKDSDNKAQKANKKMKKQHKKSRQ